MEEPEYTFLNQCVDFTQRAVCFLVVSGLILGAFLLPSLFTLFRNEPSSPPQASESKLDTAQKKLDAIDYFGDKVKTGVTNVGSSSIIKLIKDGVSQGIFFFKNYTITGYIITHTDPKRIENAFNRVKVATDKAKENRNKQSAPPSIGDKDFSDGAK